MLRDNRKNSTYFDGLLPQYVKGIENLELVLKDGSMPLPDEQTKVANDLYELCLMYAIASYSSGETINQLQPKVAKILEAKKIFMEKAGTLPPRQQIYRRQFEMLSGVNEVDEVNPITQYINTLWWLSLAVATKQSNEHCVEILRCIGVRGEDALLDHIAIALGDENKIQSNVLYYPHLYRPLFAVFNSPPDKQIDLFKSFLDEWYSSCWQTAWYNNHEKEALEEKNWDYYFGYWSLEAALIANLLRLDDSSLFGYPNYPSDLSLFN